MTAAGSITVTLPASFVRDLPVMAQRLLDRMHELLERNTDDALGEIERRELESLVDMAQFSQLVAMAVHGSAP